MATAVYPGSFDPVTKGHLVVAGGMENMDMKRLRTAEGSLRLPHGRTRGQERDR